MPKITVIDRAACQEIAKALEIALAKVDLDGVTVKVNSGRYSPENVIYKVEVAVVNPDGSVNDKLAIDWRRYCGQFGLPKDALGKVVRLNGEDVKIVGLKPRSRQYPIVGQRIRDGKRYKYSASMVALVVNQGPGRRVVA